MRADILQKRELDREETVFECPTCLRCVKTKALWPAGWVLGDGGFYCSKKCGYELSDP